MKSFDIVAIREYFPSIENPSSSTWVYNQLKEIKKFGIKPVVVSPTPKVPGLLQLLMKRKYAWKIKPSKEIESYIGLNVLRPPYIKLPNKYFLNHNIKSVSHCIDSTLKDIDFKLIHAHFGHMGISSIPLKLKRNVPLITSFYGFDLGSDKERLRKHYKRLAEVGDLFLALSEDMANDLSDLDFLNDKIVVHHLGVDIDRFIPRKELKAKEEKFIFLIVAYFTERKGIHHAIEAYKVFLKKHPVNDIKLRIVGDGPYKDKLQQLAKGVENIIFINNYISENPRLLVQQEMQNCDVFVLTSCTVDGCDKEGTPVVLMEAQACRKPCIATYHAGIPEVVIHRKTGLLVEEGDIIGISNAIEEFYLNEDKRIRFGVNARNHIEQSYNNEIQMPKLNEMYRKLMI